MAKKELSKPLHVTEQFTENPEAVLVFAGASENEPMTPSIGRAMQSPIEGKALQSIQIFSSEDFFYKEIIGLFREGYFQARAGESFSVYKQGRYRQIIYFGIDYSSAKLAKEKLGDENEGDAQTAKGEKPDRDTAYERLETLRMQLGKLRADLRIEKTLEVDLSDIRSLAENYGVSAAKLVSAISEGLMLGSYRFNRYKAQPSDEQSSFDVALVAPKNVPEVEAIATERLIVCRSSSLAKDLVNEPPNVLGALHFAEMAKKMAKKSGFDIQILGKNQLRKLKMHGILGVNAGSEEEPRLLMLSYKGVKLHAKQPPPLTLVGKGVTFDSGGMSIKSSKGMEEMKMDMSVAAVVLATVSAVASAKLPIYLTAAIPLTDNMVSASAMKVGSVLTMHNQKTVEVLNTDAEGRLILADAISYAIKTWEPERIIDLATLTGAVMVALGGEYAGLFSNDPQMASDLIAASHRSGEKVWQMPLHANYAKSLQSTVADVKNIGGPYAGSITAAMFLKNFVGDTKWAHLDIAGVMSQSTPEGYRSAGARAFGVRLLYDYIRHFLLKPT